MNTLGYGKITEGGHSGRILSVHRVVYELEVGPIPNGLQIDHLCGFSLCCNPRHLEPVTPQVNMARSSSHVAANLTKTHCPQRHEYDEANTGRKGRKRYCRTCARLSMAAKRERGLTYAEWRAEYNAAKDAAA